MCGRYGFGNPARFNELHLGVSLPSTGPRFNVAPTQDVPLVLTNRDGSRTATMARWGLIPFWADDPRIGSRMINARGDTIRTKPAFRESFARRRALMPADLFYEWQAIEGSKVKQPWCIRMPDDAPFAFAALWDRWKPRDDEAAAWVVSSTVITTEPNELMRSIHDRMPVIIPPDCFDQWLDPATSEDDAFAMVCPFAGEMRAYRIGTHVNSPARDDVQCIASMTEAG